MDKKRWIWYGILTVAAVFFVWMMWPRSLAKAFDAEEFAGMVIVSSVDHGVASQNVLQYYAEPGSEAAEKATERLEGEYYHLCLDTLVGSNGIDNIGAYHVSLDSTEGSLQVFSGTKKIFVDHDVVRLGYLGHARAKALCDDLIDILEEYATPIE